MCVCWLERESKEEVIMKADLQYEKEWVAHISKKFLKNWNKTMCDRLKQIVQLKGWHSR